jgi:hypothetical protein
MDRYAQSGTSNPELRVVKAVMTSCSAPSERRLDNDVQQLVEVETSRPWPTSARRPPPRRARGWFVLGLEEIT